jgi:hypothetical protein
MKQEATFMMDVNAKAFAIRLHQENGTVPTVRVRLFLSSSENTAQFSSVKATREFTISFPAAPAADAAAAAASSSAAPPAAPAALLPDVALPIPPEFRNANLFIEAEYASRRRSSPLFSHSLTVAVSEQTGRLVVRSAACT